MHTTGMLALDWWKAPSLGFRSFFQYCCILNDHRWLFAVGLLSFQCLSCDHLQQRRLVITGREDLYEEKEVWFVSDPIVFRNIQQERKKRKTSKKIAHERSDETSCRLRRIDDQRAPIANVLESHLSIRWRGISYGCRPEILLFNRTYLNGLKPFGPQTILLLTGDMEGIARIDGTHDVGIELRWMCTKDQGEETDALQLSVADHSPS